MIRSIVAAELLVRDLAACAAFYRDTLGLEVQESEDVQEGESDHITFKIGDLYFFVQEFSSAAHTMSEEPLEMPAGGGSPVLLAARVDDVDAMYKDLKAKGVHMLRPPADQPWGLRTAYFTDPEGNFWEIQQPVGRQWSRLPTS